MYQSLCVTLGSLPKPTRVYCGHEVMYALIYTCVCLCVSVCVCVYQPMQGVILSCIQTRLDDKMPTYDYMKGITDPENLLNLFGRECFLFSVLYFYKNGVTQIKT